MNDNPLSGSTLHTALAALVGVAAATVVKVLLDERRETAVYAPAAPSILPDHAAARAALRQAKLRELAEAARDPLYLADMQDVSEDFAFVDAEKV